MPLADARALVELYAERGDRKYERAAIEYLRRYMDEADPSLADVAQVAAVLAERSLLIRGDRNLTRAGESVQPLAFPWHSVLGRGGRLDHRPA